MRGVGAIAAIVTAAEQAGGTVMRAYGSTIIVLPAQAPAADEVLSLPEAAELAKCSVGMLKGARRTGALRMGGGQRDRKVRRSDLLTWIESRGRVESAVDDDDIARRVRRLSAVKRTG